MAIQDKRIALAQWIRSVLAEGLPLSDTVLNYMNATFGTTDLTAILDADDTGEIDSLLELIFFPDMDLQIRYESQWGSETFTFQDLEQVQALVGQSALTATLGLPDNAPAITIEVPLFARHAFVQRLNIATPPIPLLVDTLADHWPENAAIRLRVHLRNTRLTWHPEQVQLVNHFLAKIPSEEPDIEDCAVFFLSLLCEFRPKTDPFSFLVAKKFFCFQSLCKAEDFERRRNTSNMEIMMLQGNRSAHGSIAQWRQQMRWIDRICHALFGRTQFFQNPDAQCVDLPSGNDTQMMEDIIRALS